MNFTLKKSGLIHSILLASLAALLLTGCFNKKTAGDDDEETTSNVQALVTVETTPVIKTDLASTLSVTGKVDAIRKQRVLAPVGGILVSFPTLDGQVVKKGSVIGEIRTKESQSAISGAESILRSAATDEQREAAKRDLELAKSTQTSVKIIAGFDGILTNRLAGPGELVSENAELVTIVDVSSLCFSADVPATQLSGIHTGQQCAMRFPSLNDISIAGSVEEIGVQSDAQSQTVKVRIRFNTLSASQRALLKTEMPGTAAITMQVHKGILAVPRKALIRDDESQTTELVVVRGGTMAIRTPVVVGIQNDSLVEISGIGIVPNTKVVTTGASTLPDSVHIQMAAKTE